jgi:hypothetical protein
MYTRDKIAELENKKTSSEIDPKYGIFTSISPPSSLIRFLTENMGLSLAYVETEDDHVDTFF